MAPTPDRFGQLSEETRRFLEILSPRDLDSLLRIANLINTDGDLFFYIFDVVRSTRTIGKIGRWAIGGAIAIILLIKPVGDLVGWVMRR